MNIKKLDGSFNIIVNGMPYNTIPGDKYFQDTINLYKEHPEFFEIETKKEKTLEELKQDKIEELKNSRKIYRQSVIINGIDLETICNKQNLRDNIILSIHPFNEKDTEIFKNEIRFISEFYDAKEKEINNTLKDEIKNINTKFIKEK
jgi:hypothetical protein